MDERYPEDDEYEQEGMEVATEPEATALEYTVTAHLPEELPLDGIVLCRRQVAGVGLGPVNK